MARKALGRGLESLISGMDQREIRNVALKDIKPNPFQPRKTFEKEDLQELADSIKVNGIIQPVIVRRKDDKFELIAGERRFRAAQIAGLKDIPVVVKHIPDEQMLEIAIIENVQRKNLNPIDEAAGYKELADKFKYTHEEIGRRVGKSRAHISNMMRILELESKIRTMIQAGSVSLGHAKVLLSISDRNRRMNLAEYIEKHGISVRELENMASSKEIQHTARKKKKSNPHIDNIANILTEKFDRKIEIKYRNGKGKLLMEFYSKDDFEELLKKLGIKNID